MDKSGSATEIKGDFRAAMSQLASGVSLITTRSPDGAPLGMLATAVSSVTTDPPTLLVCINRSASMHAEMRASGVFCVNFLGQQDYDLAGRFSTSEARENRFHAGDWRDADTGAPMLATALAAIDCRIDQIVEVGTHEIILGSVEAVYLMATPSGGPLVYFDRAYSGLTKLNASVMA